MRWRQAIRWHWSSTAHEPGMTNYYTYQRNDAGQWIMIANPNFQDYQITIKECKR